MSLTMWDVHHDVLHVHIVRWFLSFGVVDLEELILVAIRFLCDSSGSILSPLFPAYRFLVCVGLAVTATHFYGACS